ncbi:MAG: hypothetical protein BMS9Abin29_1431 [Gemmatimonadota bacterium]|nr:MAG: hypothetical protein BMS9Abin29_1431 [Gemmatimonadota bacterium]
MGLAERVRRGVTTNYAETGPSAADPRLRGRTYAIPFDRVWNAACAQIEGAPGWHLIEANDQVGSIRATATTLVFRFLDDVSLHITLDENAQTRLDMTSRSRKGKGDLGANARRIDRFMRRLDRNLDARPEQILDALVPMP